MALAMYGGTLRILSLKIKFKGMALIKRRFPNYKVCVRIALEISDYFKITLFHKWIWETFYTVIPVKTPVQTKIIEEDTTVIK